MAAGSLRGLRRRGGDAPFRVPFHPLLPLAFIVLVSAVVLLVALNRPIQALAGFAIVLAGVPVSSRFAAPRMSR
jgi:hypothetical protein